MQNEPEVSGAPSRASTNLPELQALHSSLLRAYTGISQRTKRLSPARPYLLAHVREGSERLRRAYTAAVQSEERSDVRQWLKERSDDLDLFIKRLDESNGRLGRFFRLAKRGWSVATTSYSVVLSVLTPTAAVATLSAVVITAINACLCEIFVWTARALLASLFIIGLVGFWVKRGTLLKWSAAGQEGDNKARSRLNVYETEQKLLSKVDAPRHGEIQWDVITWFLLAATFLAIKYFAPLISSHTEQTVISLFDPRYVAAAYAAGGVIALWWSLRRPWGWRPMI